MPLPQSFRSFVLFRNLHFGEWIQRLNCFGKLIVLRTNVPPDYFGIPVSWAIRLFWILYMSGIPICSSVECGTQNKITTPERGTDQSNSGLKLIRTRTSGIWLVRIVGSPTATFRKLWAVNSYNKLRIGTLQSEKRNYYIILSFVIRIRDTRALVRHR